MVADGMHGACVEENGIGEPKRYSRSEIRPFNPYAEEHPRGLLGPICRIPAQKRIERR